MRSNLAWRPVLEAPARDIASNKPTLLNVGRLTRLGRGDLTHSAPAFKPLVDSNLSTRPCAYRPIRHYRMCAM
jgi:hypothetical protein